MTPGELADKIADARAAKARKLFEVAAGHGMKTADIERMNEQQWRMLAEAARVAPPSDRTKQAVIEMMKRRNVRTIR